MKNKIFLVFLFILVLPFIQSQIFFEKFDVIYNDSWYLDNNYFIYLKIYDLNNNSYDPGKIEINLKTNLSYSNLELIDKNITRDNVGSFYKGFSLLKINKTERLNITALIFDIIVGEDEKILNQTIEIRLKEYSWSENMQNKINSEEFPQKIYDRFKEDGLIYITLIIVIFLILIFVSIFISLKKKKNE